MMGIPFIFTAARTYEKSSEQLWDSLLECTGLAPGSDWRLPGHVKLEPQFDKKNVQAGDEFTIRDTQYTLFYGVVEIWDPENFELKMVIRDLENFGFRSYRWKITSLSGNRQKLRIKVVNLFSWRFIFSWRCFVVFLTMPMYLLGQVIRIPFLNLAAYAKP